MRASTLRAKIVSAIEGISTYDSQATANDIFRHIESGMRDQQAGQDRLFSVKLSSVPTRARIVLPNDSYQISFDVFILYQDSPAVEDRIADDAERVSQAIEKLPHENTDLNNINNAGGAVTEIEGQILVQYTVTCVYRLDSGV